MPGVDIDIDFGHFERFAALARREMDRVATEYYQKGGQLVVDLQVQEAKTRFGVETAESHMESYEPQRPKGLWAGSVRAEVDKDGARIGPRVPYAAWIEDGSRAEGGIPLTHVTSSFIGHRPVNRASEKARAPLSALFERLATEGLARSAST